MHFLLLAFFSFFSPLQVLPSATMVPTVEKLCLCFAELFLPLLEICFIQKKREEAQKRKEELEAGPFLVEVVLLNCTLKRCNKVHYIGQCVSLHSLRFVMYIPRTKLGKPRETHTVYQKKNVSMLS